ncbi:MAG: UDP-N-acetylmuramate dehydrogenase [Bacillota bacterium]|nr:UDP-N-acetylmuramate dehydrogenase [Bacillota bacterium]
MGFDLNMCSMIKEAADALVRTGIKFSENELMSGHTSFKIGGAADVFVCPENVMQITRAVEIAKKYELPFTVIGNGSNVLVSDLGIEGMVICLERMNGFETDGCSVIAESGALLSKVAMLCARNSLTGMEFAAGIPGSVGGAVYMNAGAYGGEMKNIVKSITALHNDKIEVFLTEKCDFKYRHSIFSDGGYIILSVEFELKNGNENEIRAQMKELAMRRREKQPLEYPSAGSTFKRPEGNFAGTLIQQAGLKGYSVGGAQVSEKHAGFVINKGGATCADVLSLIEHIKAEVFRISGVALEEEVRVVGKKA